MKKVENILIIGPWHLTQGMAPATRIIAYCKGLQQNNVKVDNIIYYPNKKEEGVPISGIIDGVPYEYAYQRDTTKSTFHRKIIDWPLSMIKVILLAIKRYRNNKYDFIFLSFDYINMLFIFAPILNICGAKIVFVADEYPDVIRNHKQTKISVHQKLLYKLIFQFIDSRILINPVLANYYNQEICKKPTHVMASIINIDRFNVPIIFVEKKHLIYVGGMDLSNDNIDLIIKAFSIISHKYNDIDLLFYGPLYEKDKPYLESLIEQGGVKGLVHFKGQIDYHEVPKVLCQAYILVTSQSKTKRADGGIPTKLGEYLACGKPVIFSDISNLSSFLNDGKQIYFVQPDNIELYAAKLQYILDHYNEALVVGQKGKEYCLEHYGARKVTIDLVAFLNSQLNR